MLIFPVPITFWLWKKKTWKKWIRVTLCLISWLIYFSLIIGSIQNQSPSFSDSPNLNQVPSTTENNSTPTPSTSTSVNLPNANSSADSDSNSKNIEDAPKISQKMEVQTRFIRKDDNNIGKDWWYEWKIDGKEINSPVELKIGQTITCSALFTEDDKKPDVGQNSLSHTVTEKDLNNGFTVKFSLEVTENNGKNKGKTAVFDLAFNFTPKNN